MLARGGGSGSQVGRGRGERARALRGSIAVRDGRGRRRARVLVDDVVTTGATLAGCAAALADSRVPAGRSAVAYARTPGR